jgi:hypothetical protein
MVNIWQDNTKKIPTGNDSQIVRVPMDQLDIGGRKDHIPKSEKSSDLAIAHVPNRG